MKDKETNKLTEKLKVNESKVYNLKIDLKGIGNKLNYAYEYEQELLERLKSARTNTNNLQLEFFKTTGLISEQYDEMKKIVDVFTGNFYDHLKS